MRDKNRQSLCVFRFLVFVWFDLVLFGSHHIVMQYNVLQTICFVSLLRFSFHSFFYSTFSSCSSHFIHSHISQYCSILFFPFDWILWHGFWCLFLHFSIVLQHSSNCFFLIKLLQTSQRDTQRDRERQNVEIWMWWNWNFW